MKALDAGMDAGHYPYLKLMPGFHTGFRPFGPASLIRMNRGFTLIEVLLVLVILAVVAGLASRLFVNPFQRDGRELAWRLTSVVRYLYTQAASENKTIRLTFDFENQSWWAEETTGSAKIKMQNEKFEDQKVKEKDEKGEGQIAEEQSAEEGEGAEFMPPQPTFTMIPDLVERRLPSSIFLKDIYTGHDAEPVTAGAAYIYFFPNGYVEPAVINFRNEADEKHLSLKINPLTGEVEVAREYKGK